MSLQEFSNQRHLMTLLQCLGRGRVVLKLLELKRKIGDYLRPGRTCRMRGGDREEEWWAQQKEVESVMMVIDRRENKHVLSFHGSTIVQTSKHWTWKQVTPLLWVAVRTFCPSYTCGCCMAAYHSRPPLLCWVWRWPGYGRWADMLAETILHCE